MLINFIILFYGFALQNIYLNLLFSLQIFDWQESIVKINTKVIFPVFIIFYGLSSIIVSFSWIYSSG